MGTTITDYYSLIAKVMARKSAGETRDAVYERVRKAQREAFERQKVAQFQMNRERSALAQAIRDFEAQALKGQGHLHRPTPILGNLFKASEQRPSGPITTKGNGSREGSRPNPVAVNREQDRAPARASSEPPRAARETTPAEATSSPAPVQNPLPEMRPPQTNRQASVLASLTSLFPTSCSAPSVNKQKSADPPPPNQDPAQHKSATEAPRSAPVQGPLESSTEEGSGSLQESSRDLTPAKDAHLDRTSSELVPNEQPSTAASVASRVGRSELAANKGAEGFVLVENPPQSAADRGPDESGNVHPRLQAMIQAARYHGTELDLGAFRQTADEPIPSAAALAVWAQDAGMWARAVRLSWRHLLRFNDSAPVVLLFNDGSAGLLSGSDAAQNVVLLKDPNAPAGGAPVPVDELRLSQVWAGEAVLVRAARGHSVADAQFNLRWLAQLVLHEHRFLRDIALASFTISILTIFPPLLVMATVNKVLQFHSMSTLVLIAAILAVVIFYETLLGYARRLVISVVSARIDARLNLHLFNRLLRLPLDYFERHPAGETMYRIAQIYRVREFLTGKLLTTLLDLITLCVLLPLLFFLNAALAGIVLVCAIAISIIVLAFLKPLRTIYSRVTAAETWKSAALGETIVGIKTVKALALEPQRKALWDERIAESGKWQLAFARSANWPQTLVTPLERLMVVGTLLIGVYMAMNDPSGYMVGGLFAFMMLSGRVAAPLVGMARLVEEFEEVNAAIGEAAFVLNRPLEVESNASGLRPKFSGAISFQDVTFTYAGTKLPALERVNFDIPAGTMLGIVGRSGSGKSTIARLLQGINRDYQGYIKIDGADLREVDLRHLRQSFGVVLQSNFLFRGSIRDNIIAGRPGLTLSDAVYAARLSGAEEFIERMPGGYDTYIEEGSPNLSGGQAQRLAIARALIHDPRIVLLDEATSALDPESEAVVSANLLRIAQGRTMIIVSHRLSSLIECDQILVMDQGKVIDIAPHTDLLERCALYRQLWAQQNRHLDGRSSSHEVVPAPRLVPGSQ
jgi:ATP-binding cassette subfamily B protein